MSNSIIWGFPIDRSELTEIETDYINSLPQTMPSVEWVWDEMDRAWDQLSLDNLTPLKGQNIAGFYTHPIWLINGIFTSLDPTSNLHRVSIATYLSKLGLSKIADYGGGFGELALVMTKMSEIAEVSIVEPFPSRYGLARVKEHRKIKFVIDLGTAKYDAIVAQDVLEHVEDPVQLAHAIANGVSVGGYLIFANSFLPMIKCHLPATFHLRHTFSWVMKKMGLIYVGRIDGANHALVFRRVCEVNLKSARHAEKISNRIGPILNSIRSNLAFAKRFVVSLSAVSK